MVYEPTVWKTGNIVSSQKLNKIQNGIANNNVIILEQTIVQDGNTTTHTLTGMTAEEVYNAFLNGKTILIYVQEEQDDENYSEGYCTCSIIN